MVIIGPPVWGADMMGREQDMAGLWDAIGHGSVQMISPRRFGKTSMMMDMENRPRSGYGVAVAGFKIKTRKRGDEDWAIKGDHLFKKLVENKGQLVLAIDELPTMILDMMHDMDTARTFLRWLRHLRLSYGIRYLLKAQESNDAELENRCTAAGIATAGLHGLMRQLEEDFYVSRDAESDAWGLRTRILRDLWRGRVQ